MNSSSGAMGPFIGHVTQNSARVWLRDAQDHSGSAPVTVALLADGREVARQFVSVSQSADRIAVANFEGLSPDTNYKVSIANDEFPAASFRTDREAKSGKSGFRFGLGSCRYLFWDNPVRRDGPLGDRIFRSILAEHETSALDFMLFLGDQVYADPLNFLWRSSSLEEYFKLYRTAFGQPGFQELLRNVPSYMIMDDHEIRDGWSLDDLGAEESRYVAAMQAYNAYQHSRNPVTAPGVFHYSFERCGLPFFVMDTRSERRKNREMINFAQMNTLQRWLSSNRSAPVRFIASSVPFFPDEHDVGDGWGAYDRQRGELLEYIRSEKIGPVVFLGGDAHASSVTEMTCRRDPNFYVASVVSSPLFWPYGFGRKSQYREAAVLKYADWSVDARFEYEMRAFVGANNFVVLNVPADAAAGIGVQICGSRGEPLGAARLKFGV